VIAVNKMDLVEYREEVFHSICADFGAFAGQIGNPPDLQFIPLSALCGDNVVHPSTRMPWYQGPSLLEALEKFRAFGGQFTAVITDVGMPRMSGDDLAAILRSMAPNLSIIASTGILSESQTMTKMKALKAAGVEIVLNKPFTSDLLMNALKKALPASETTEPATSPRIITFPPYHGESASR